MEKTGNNRFFFFSDPVHLEKILVFFLSGLAISIFFSQTGIDIFGLASLAVLLLMKYVFGYATGKKLPFFLLAAAGLYILGLIFSAFRSTNSVEGFRELGKFWNFVLGGMLFTTSFTENGRKGAIIAFFAGASLSGLLGIFQYFGIFMRPEERAHGFTHPIHYAANLAFAFGAALILLMFRSRTGFKGRDTLKNILPAALFSSACGIIFSLTRGVWIAVLISSFVILTRYEFRRFLIITLSALLICSAIFSISPILRSRAFSILTSDDRGSTENRLELWKGALMIFQKYPVFGAGTGDFESETNKLIAQGRIKPVLAITTHAHNIYLHTLATQGAVGIIILVAFLSSLLVWASLEIRRGGNISGYVILVAAILTIVGGVTENNIGVSKYIAAFSITIGLFGGISEEKTG